MLTDQQVILSALQKERDELHERIMQLDRIVKRIKSLDYSNDTPNDSVKQLAVKQTSNKAIAPVSINKPIDIKMLIINILFRNRQKH